MSEKDLKILNNLARKVLTNPNEIKISKEKYDWLGNGMYFWENKLKVRELINFLIV